jgi:hypothetical protein
VSALDYPYAIPDRSYVYAAGRACRLEDVEVERSGRTALLAYGSNAAPAVLARKLAVDPDPVLLLRASLHGFDVVYSAHLSAYGAVPATLHASPGTVVRTFVAYFTAAQLELIAPTEPNYDLTMLRDVDCRLDDGTALREVAAYLSHHGCLLDGAGSPIALAAIEARGRVLPELSQRQAQRRFGAASRLSSGEAP